MKKFIVSLLMLVMIWTVVDTYFQGNSKTANDIMYYVLENENDIRKVIRTDDYLKNPIIVGDKVKIMIDRWGTETLQRVN